MTENPYRAPLPVYQSLFMLSTPLVLAVKGLGPGRVQWNPAPNPRGEVFKSPEKTVSKWLLDGRQATVGEVIRAWEAEKGKVVTVGGG